MIFFPIILDGTTLAQQAVVEQQFLPLSGDALDGSLETTQDSTSTILWDAFGSSTPIMEKIAQCESGENQNAVSITSDYGYFQIHSSWDKKAKELGLDYKHSFKDNVAMAAYILSQEGLKAWVCAKILSLL